MGARPIEYNVVGRYLNQADLRDVVGYHVISTDGTRQKQLSMDQMAFLVGKGQILNVVAQIYKDKLLYRGVGISLDSLPYKTVIVNKPNTIGNITGQNEKGADYATKIQSLGTEFFKVVANGAIRKLNGTQVSSKREVTAQGLVWSIKFIEGISSVQANVELKLTLSCTDKQSDGIVELNLSHSKGLISNHFNKAGKPLMESPYSYDIVAAKAYDILESYNIYITEQSKLRVEGEKLFKSFLNRLGQKLKSREIYGYQILDNMFIEAKIREHISGKDIVLEVQFIATLGESHRVSKINDASLMIYIDENGKTIEFRRDDVSFNKSMDSYDGLIGEVYNRLSLMAMPIKHAITVVLEKYYSILYEDNGVSPVYNKIRELDFSKINNPAELYDKAIRIIDSQYERFAYTTSKIITFLDQSGDVRLNIECQQDNMYYVSINKWGYTADTTAENTRDYLIIDSSTMELLNNITPNLITSHNYGNIDISLYKMASYHRMLIRLRKFNLLMDFKQLKLLFLRLNKSVFDSKISNDIVVGAGNYSLDNSGKVRLFESLNNCSAYAGNKNEIIFFNGGYHTLQTKQLSRIDEITLIHEMCHSYVNVVDGSNWEDNPNDYGDVVYGLSREKYGRQVECHGRRYGRAVQMASERTGIPFEIIFGYDLDKGKRWEGYIGPDNNRKTVYEDGTNLGLSYTYGKTKLIKWFNSNIDEMIHEIGRYSNWFHDRLNVKINAHKDDKSDDNRETADLLIKLHDIQDVKVLTYRIVFEQMKGGVLAFGVYRDYEDTGKGYIIRSKCAIGKSKVSDVVRQSLQFIKDDITNAA